MRARRFLIALFALGTVGGYGSALASASCHARRAADRLSAGSAWERHVAHLCADAAKHPAGAADEDARPW
jgi:hypothetical protein